MIFLERGKILTESITKIARRDDIQALRGFAVISVLLFHFNKGVFSFGYLGVDVFFVISGFVISNLIYSEITNNTFSFKSFFSKRFKRIIPALLSYGIFVQIIIYFVLDHRQIIETSKTLMYSLGFLSNIHLSRYLPYFDSGSEYNLVVNLWSLSVEEQFYIIFPFIAFGIRRIKINLQIIIYTLLLLLSLIFMNKNFYNIFNLLESIFLSFDNFLFYSPLTRGWEFLLGVLGMFINQKYIRSDKKIGTASSGLLVLSLFFFTFSNVGISNTYRLFIVNILIFILLIFKTDFKNKKFKVLKFFIFTGNISYSLYLFHQGIFAGIRNHNSNTTSLGNLYIDMENLFIVLAVFIAIYLFSWANFTYIEERFRKEKSITIKKFKPLILMTFFFIIFSVLSQFTNGYSFRSSELESFGGNVNIEFLEGTNYVQQDDKNCLNRAAYSNLCMFGEENNQQLFIVGDSVISTLVSGFLNEQILSKYRIYEFTKGGCPLLYGECGFFESSENFNTLSNIKNSIVILGGRYQKYFDKTSDIELNEKKLLKTISLFLDNSNEVYFLTPIPEPSLNERMYYLVNNDYPVFDYDEWKASIVTTNNVLKNISLDNFTIINSEVIFCSDKNCNFRDNETYFFLDHVHLTYFGARNFADSVVNILSLKN